MNFSGEQDIQILSQVKKTAARSKKLTDDLQNLKSKMYSIEKDMRNI
jgi:conjugal transfer/entry exclusion protein